MSNYAVISNDTNICDNVIVLDEGSTWFPPPGHYILNIDGLQVGIGWHYDPATQVWTAPPIISAYFDPSPIFISQSTNLIWQAENVDSVTIDGESYPVSGTKSYTPSAIGKFTVAVTATNVAATIITNATVNVAATREELGI